VIVTEQHKARAARLFRGKGTSGSGGLLLPEVFREVFTTLLDDGPTSRLILHKIIRNMIGYKSERVTDVWGSWEAFCDDLLYLMEEEGFLSRENDSWALTGKAAPDTQLLILSDPENHGRRIRVTFSSRKDQQIREVIADAWRKAGELVKVLEPYRDRSPVVSESYHGVLSVSVMLQEALSAPKGSLAPPQEEQKPGRRVGDRRSGGSRKPRPKPAPPDEPEVTRACIGVCSRILPLTREYFECYWSERKLVSGEASGDWYWRWDCKDCHGRAKSTGSARDKQLRKQRKEELRIRIAEVGEPYPSIYSFVRDLNMDSGSIRSMWQQLHQEGKAPPLPPPPPSYPRPPKNK
jgi:hypothetical protein